MIILTTLPTESCAALDREVKAMGGSYEIDTKLVITPVFLSEEMLGIMEESCKERGYSYKTLPSGAGHDALEIGQIIPTVMLFVPSKDGRSHCPVEFTSTVILQKHLLL